MDIIIRKIGDRSGRFMFLPNAKSGFRFADDSAEPKLSPFQRSCLQTSPQKNKKQGCFWTPSFCYIGMLVAKDGGFALDEMLSVSSEHVKGFNKHFPNRNWYWYSKPKRQNIAVQTFFAGVRVASGLIVCYYDLMRVGRVTDANRLYKNYLEPTGLARLLDTSDSELITDADRTHKLVIEDGLFTIAAKNEHATAIPVIAEKKKLAPRKNPLQSEIGDANVTNNPPHIDVISAKRSAEIQQEHSDEQLLDRGEIKRPSLPKISKQDSHEYINESDRINEGAGRKKNPFQLSKVGKL